MVDSRLINAKFVNYNDRAPPPSRLPDVTHVTLSPRPSPPFLYWKRSKTGGGNGLGTRLGVKSHDIENIYLVDKQTNEELTHFDQGSLYTCLQGEKTGEVGS